ncbi:MAG: hypothetical protein RL701_1524, partial [Pseudomonadota bacterium]
MMGELVKHCGITTRLLAICMACAACSADDKPAVRYGSKPGTGATGGGGATLANVGSGGSAAIGSSLGGRSSVVGSAGDSSQPAQRLDPNECASATVTATRVTPTVHFVIDGSGSMNAPFGGGNGTRWSVLRDALVGDKGVITQLQNVAKFGTTIYADGRMCPSLTTTDSALKNLEPIRAMYPQQEPGGGTPTGESLQKVVDGLKDYGGPDNPEHPPIIILATDGEPNGCAGCNWAVDWAACLGMIAAPPTYDTTIAAVRAAQLKSVPVWVISLADGLAAIPDLQKTANIGAGLADNASPGATIYSPKNTDELVGTLTKLLGAALTCEVSLAGMIQVGRACEGTVTMNGTAIPCNDAQGWK